jgi:hypothetical protein
MAYLMYLPIYLPPVWDHFDAIHQVDSIKPGVTTKEEVIHKFGQPDAQDTSGMSILYTGYHSDGLFVGPGGGDFRHHRKWTVVVCFDENDVVTIVSTIGVYYYLWQR